MKNAQQSTGNTGDTIFALATVPGKSGVAIIRVSGPQAKETLKAFGVPLPSPRVVALATLHGSDGNAIDRGLALYFPAPNSFTGEDVVEYHVHGSRAVIRQIIERLSTLSNLRTAEPGEFARRAFLNGKFDLTAAEGLADLIDAESEAQRRQALRLMQGEAAVFFEALRAGILHALAYLEAYIDFPDEDIPPHVLAEIDVGLARITPLIENQLADKGVAEKIRDGIYVTILGAPNVGKSSLMNLLAARDVAIVSHIAGTTRDVIEVHLDIEGYPVILADTAGLREHADDIEREGMRRSLCRAKEADITIVVLDAQNAQDNPQLLSLIDERTILVASKSDFGLPSPLPVIQGHSPIPVSVKERTGIHELIEALKSRVLSGYAPGSSFITRARHRKHLTDALEHLHRFPTMQQAPLELRCEELRRAATEIGKITGKIATDELLGHIFASFCIGK